MKPKIETFTFEFPIDAKLVLLAQNAKMNKGLQIDPYTDAETKEASLLLVKDSGVYLLSPFMAQGYEGRRYTKRGKLVCCYATGHGPDTHLSGDDFGFNLPIADMVDALALNRTLQITMKRTWLPVESNYTYSFGMIVT